MHTALGCLCHSSVVTLRLWDAVSSSLAPQLALLCLPRAEYRLFKPKAGWSCQRCSSFFAAWDPLYLSWCHLSRCAHTTDRQEVQVWEQILHLSFNSSDDNSDPARTGLEKNHEKDKSDRLSISQRSPAAISCRHPSLFPRLYLPNSSQTLFWNPYWSVT